MSQLLSEDSPGIVATRTQIFHVQGRKGISKQTACENIAEVY